MTDAPVTQNSEPATTVTDPAAAAAAASGGGTATTSSATEPVAPPPYTPLDMTAFKMPEGFAVDETSSTEFLKIVNDARLPAPVAQNMIELQAKYLHGAEEAANKQWEDTQTAWKEQIAKLPEIGGSNLAATEVAIAKVLDAHGSPELRQMLDITGAGNHPTMVVFLHKLSKLLNEDQLTTGRVDPGAQKTRAERMYPTS